MSAQLKAITVVLVAAISMAACGSMGHHRCGGGTASRAEDAARRAEIAAASAQEAAQRADDAAIRLERKATSK